MKKMSWRDNKGAASVEFAIVAVLFLALVFGIIEFGILMFDKQVLTNASREGARAGVVMRVPRVSDATIQSIVNQYAQEHMVSFGSSSTLTTIVRRELPPGSGSLFGSELEVEVTYPFNFLVLSNFGLGPKLLKAETRMRME